ncbi:MAG TPA: putative dsRNA-binding protein [Methanoregula sp.]|nr:putative dsRNA-binding protein [Methanoregula sp.]
MNNLQKKLLKEHLPDPDADFNQKLREFIKIFNSDFSDPDLQSGTWNISNDEWQRYEFLGDRVLNLVAADYLYHQAPLKHEGEMTKMMGVVSNESLTGIINRNGIDIALLIPETIGQQQTYGEKIKGGAFEAFIGALYEIVGFEVTRTIVLNVLSGEIEQYDPNQNVKGILQEFFQKKDKSTVPEYRETLKNGTDHNPVFTCQVFFRNEFLGEGTGESKQQAEQAAAKRALEKIMKVS